MKSFFLLFLYTYDCCCLECFFEKYRSKYQRKYFELQRYTFTQIVVQINNNIKHEKNVQHGSILTRSYRFLSFSAIASYLDLTVGSTSDHFFPNSLAMSPTPYSGFNALTFVRSSLQNQKKADLKFEMEIK